MENAEATVDGTQNVCAVHGQAEAGVAEVGERIPFHTGRFVCREECLLFGFRLVLFSEDPEHHLGVQPFLVEDPQVAVLLLNGLVELLEMYANRGSMISSDTSAATSRASISHRSGST